MDDFPNFFEFVDKKAFYKISRKRRTNAFRSAMKYIHSIKIMDNTEQEFEHFIKFYQVFFNALPELKMHEEDITKIAKDLVFNCDKYAFFPDAIEIVPKLKDRYTLSIVSDAWPSLDDVYKHNDFYKHFDSFINSSRIGVTKPNALMYTSALEATNHTPDEAVFVDDRVKNCGGAKAVGIDKTYLMCRNKLEYIYRRLTVKEHTVIRNLHMLYDDLLKL